MEFDLDIALEFVEKVNPEPTPIEYITGQTGDVMLPVILAAIMLLLVSFGAFMFFKKRKAHPNEGMSASGAVSKTATLSTSKWIALAIITALVTALAFFTGSIVQAQAGGGQSDIETPSKVKAYIDKDAGTVEFDSSYLKNISDHNLIIQWSNVSQPEESAAIADLKNSKFTIKGMGGTIFDGSPNPDIEYVPEDLSTLEIGQTSDMNFALTNVSTDELLKLIGQKVFAIKFHFRKDVVPAPLPKELTYNGQTQTGVDEGVGYTLSGTTEAKDVGTYTATAKLINGYIWEDGSYTDKTITWTMDKLSMTITSADGEKTYDGTKLSKEEVTEDPAFPEGEGFTYTWTSNVVNVEDTVDANNTFTYNAQAGTSLNNYEVTPVYGKLTITPRAITLQSGTENWTYDAITHSCKTVEVAEGSWVGTDGVTYENFASVIDHSDQPKENTFEYEAKEGTFLSNYEISVNYGEIQIDKIATPIEVTANSNEKTYDATVLKDNGYTYIQGILKRTDQLDATISGEIKNVGTADNTVGEVKIMRGSKDATANYTFGEHKNGTLTINKRPITLTSATDTFAYDGQAHYNHNITVGGQGWASTEYATYSNFASITDYVEGGVENSFEYNKGADTDFDNYDISVTCGKLSIRKISTPIVVTAASATKVYDGQPLANGNYTYTDKVLLAGDTLKVTIEGQATDVDTPGKNTVTKVEVLRGTEDATSNYTFGSHVDGTLTITKKDVTVKSEDHDWTYDGAKHSWNVVESTGFVEGEGITPTNFPEIKDYVEGGLPNIFDCTEQTGTKLSNYNLIKETGTIKINKRDITISSVGASFEYNAQEQSKPDIKIVSGEWVTGEGVDCSNFKTAIDYNGDGVDNTFSYKQNEKTNLTNYNLSVQYEKLQITKVAIPIVVTAGTSSKTYDGDALTDASYTYTDGVLKESDALTATTSGSITNAGETDNHVSSVTISRGENDATNNYIFGTHVSGKLTVNRRDIVLQSASGEWTYDGQSHSAPSAAPAEATSWAKSEDVVYSGFPSVTNCNGAGIDNEFEITAKEGTNLNNYNVTPKYGKLIVKQVSTEIVVTANSKTREYDGTKLTDSGYTYTQGVLVNGDDLTATVEADNKPLNAGDTAANKVTSVKVMRGAQEVTDNYTFGTHVNGTLEVTKRNVVLQSEGYTWTYNSMAHGNQVAKVKDGFSFAPGEGVSYSNFASIIDHTEEPVPNTFDYTWNEGTIPGNYNITREYGNLVINKITTPLIVTADTYSKTYDGTSLTDDGITYTPNVLKGTDFVTATNVVQKDGQPFILKDVGQADNVVTNVKVMRGDEDATKNYTFGTHVKGSLTITKRNITVTSETKSFIYDGSAHSWPNASITSGTLVEGESVTYTNFATVTTVAQGKVDNTFTVVAEGDTKLSNYEITYKLGVIEIASNDTPIIVTAASDEKTYDGTELTNSGFTYTENVLAEGDTLTATITGSITDAGTADNEVSNVKVTNSKGEDVTLNYKWGTHVKGTLTITKRDVTLVSKSEEWDYDGKAHSSVGVSVKEGTSWATGEGAEYSNYKEITDHQSQPIENQFTYDPLGDTDFDNYNISFEYGTLQINKIETLIVVKPATKSKVYDGTALTDNSYTFTPNVLVDGDELDVVIVDSITDVGETTNSVQSYKVMRGDTEATVNYNLAVPEVGKLIVTERPITLTSGTESWEYDGDTHFNDSVTVTGEGWVAGEEPTYNNFPTVKDVIDGEKVNTFDITGDTKLTNYDISIVNGKISINKVSAELIVTANSKTKSYDGAAVTDTGFTHTEVLKKSDEKVVARISGSQTDAGSSVNVVVEGSVKVLRNNSVDISDNYTFGTHVNGTLTVNQRPITLTSDSYEGTYDGQEHSATTVTVGGEGLVSGQVLKCTNFAKIKNYVEGGVSNTFTFALEGGVSTDNYEVTYNYGTLTVNKKAVTLTSGGGSRAYNGLALTVETVTPVGFIDGEGATYSNFTSVIDVCTDTPNKFEYVLKDGTLADNYIITPSYGKLTITPYTGAIKVTAKSDSKKYDGTALTKNDYTVEGSIAETDQFEVTIEGSITDVVEGGVPNEIKSLKIMRGTVDATSNYSNVTKANGTLTITPRSVTLTSGDYNAEYDGVGHTINSLTISGDGFVGEEGLESYSDFPTVIDVCSNTPNTFTYQLKENTKAQNYTITKVEGKLTITKVATPIVVTANSDSKIYDGDPLTNSGYTNTGETKGSDQLVVVINGTITNAVSVTNTVSSVQVTRQDGDVTKDVSTNYNLGPHVNGTLTVNKKDATLTSGNYTAEYDGVSHSNTNVEADGFVDGEGVESYSDFATIIDVGSKPNEFKYTLKTNTSADNYNITITKGTLTVSKVSEAIVLKAASDEKTYDGQELKNEGFEISSGEIKGHDVISAKSVGSQTNFGVGNNNIDKNSISITRDGANVIDNYTIADSHEKGRLTVNKRTISYTWNLSDSEFKLGEYDGNNHKDMIFASITNKVEGDEVSTVVEVTEKGKTDVLPTVVDAGTYTATITDLSGSKAVNYALPDAVPTQDYVLDKTDSTIQFSPGEIITFYSTEASQENSFDKATAASGDVTYTITGGDTGGFSIPDSTKAKINAVARQGAKTSYSIEITAHDSGDKNHNPGDKKGTLTWTIKKATPEDVKWNGVSEDGYKLDRNVPVADYVFVFEDEDISVTSSNEDDDATVSISGTDLPDGVTVDGEEIVIDPTVYTDSVIKLTVKGKINESSNYEESDEVSTTIDIAISSLWWRFDSDTVYLSPFNTNQEATENSKALSSTSTDDVEWLSQGTNIESVVIQGSSSEPAIKPVSMAYWFCGLTQLNSFTGFNWVNFENVSNFTSMFENASKISSLDLSNFTVDSGDTTTSMFAGCSSLETIKIGSNWARAFNDCSLPGEAWLDANGKSYLIKDIPTSEEGTYNLANYKLHINKPDDLVASLVLTTEDGVTEFPDDIFFNDEFKLKLTTHTEEDTYFDVGLYDYVVEFNDYITVEVVKQETTKYTYNGSLQVKQDGYQFNSWDVEKTIPSEIYDDHIVYDINGDYDVDTLSVTLQAEKHATAVQYSNGSMAFYYDNLDHSKDTNFIASYNVANTKVNDETYNPSSTAAKVPEWMSSAYHPFNNVTSITFHESFKDFKTFNHHLSQESTEGYKHIGTLFNSMSGWFMNFSNVESISGWNYVPSGVVDTRYMFYGFKNSPSMTTLDLSDFDMSNVIFANSMFANFGNNCGNVILPSGVSSNVDVDMLQIYDANKIDYSNMFADASTLQNITFGGNFGSSDFPTSYRYMMKNCISIKKLDLTNCLNLGSSTDCDTEGMLNGCIGINSFIVGFGISDPFCEKGMVALGLEESTQWLSDSGVPYTPENVPAKEVWYNCQSLIHLHFSNQAEFPSAGGYGTSSTYSYDMDVFRFSAVKFNSVESKIQIGYMPDDSTFMPCSEIRFYVNDPYMLEGFEGEFEKKLADSMNFMAHFSMSGELTKTPKAVKINDTSVSENPRFIFCYDTLTEADYRASYGTKVEAFFQVKNTLGLSSIPEWIDNDEHKNYINNCEVIFDKSFKDFTSYTVNGQTVQFKGMANWFSECSIKTLQGFENIPSCVTDIQGIFFRCDIMDSHDCIDLSKWDMSYIWFADCAFYTGPEIRYEKLIIPDNFSSKRSEESTDYAQINHMFVNPEPVGTYCKIHEIILGKNFGANAIDFSQMFYAMPELINVQLGENFASCKKQAIGFQMMFAEIPTLISVDLSGLSEGGTYDISYMFSVQSNNTALTTLVMPRKNVYFNSAAYAFAGLLKLTSLDFTHCIFTSQPSYYEGMLTYCYSLGEIVVGDSWMEDASLAWLGCPTDTNFPWFIGDTPFDLHDPTQRNSIYINHGVVKLRLYIPDEYKNIASFSYNGYEGLTAISLNLLTYNQATYRAGCWYMSGKNTICVITGLEELYFDLKCSDDIYFGEWSCNYEEHQDVSYEKGDVDLHPILQPKVTPKAVWYYNNSTLKICNDSVSYEGSYVKVDYLTNDWHFNMYATANVVIDPSFKDCYQYWDKKESKYKEFNSCANWFSERSINSITGLENMSSNIKYTESMFAKTVVATDNFTFDLRGWDMSNIEIANGMFMGVSSSFEVNTTKVYLPDNFGALAKYTQASNMFTESCFSNIDFGQNFAPHARNFENMFGNMHQIQSLDLSTFSSTQDVNLTRLCCNCNYLSSIKLWSCEVVPEQMNQAFARCPHLSEVDMSKINIQNSSSANGLFEECKSLSKLKFGDMPEDTTITSLGYSWEFANLGRWYAGERSISEFWNEPLLKGVVYENKDYVNLTISSPSNVSLKSEDILKYDLIFKVLTGSQIVTSQSSKTLEISFDGKSVVAVNVPEQDPSGLMWQNWDFNAGIDEGKIKSDANISAYYNDGKTAKAVIYGISSYEKMGHPTEMRFVYDNLTYEPGHGDVVEAFTIYNTSAVDDIYPPWATKKPGEPDFYPKKVVIDASFKDVNKCFNIKTHEGYEDFYSMDYWFAGMYNVEIEGLENIPTNKIKSAQYTFKQTGPNDEIPELSAYNPYCSSLDLRCFAQDNLENIFGMFLESNYSDILLSQTFGINAKNIGKLFYNSIMLTHVDLSGVDTDKLDVDTYGSSCYEYAVAGLDRINSFKVGINWDKTMESVGFEDGKNMWVDYRGNLYSTTNKPEPNVLYKDANWHPDLLALLNADGQTGDDQLLNEQNSDDDSQDKATPTENDRDNMPSAGGAAALVGAPLALAALGFRRRISGKHVKIK